MKWFKTLWLTSEEREILRKAKEPKPIVADEAFTSSVTKNIFYSGNNITVVFWDGDVIAKSDVPFEVFQRVSRAKDREEIEALLIVVSNEEDNKVAETEQDKKLVSKSLDIFYDNSDFVVKGTEVYMKGVNLAIPAVVVASFIEILEKAQASLEMRANRDVVDSYDNQYNALKMFWLKLALNTIPQSREDLLTFVRKNDVRITRNGNLILYRRIVTKSGADTKFVTFVTQSYYNVKKSGLDPREYAIAKDLEDYLLVDLDSYEHHDDPNEAKPFINLQQAYLELPTYETNTFTAAHDRGVDIRLGGIYKIPEDKINLDNGLCAAGGLHAAAVDYDYSGFGDMPVVVLVNPSKAITVPVYETGKLRTTEMFVACVNDKPIGQHFDEDTLSAFDSEYHDLTLSELEDAAKAKSFEKLSVQDTVPAVSLVDLNTIKEMLKDRVKHVI